MKKPKEEDQVKLLPFVAAIAKRELGHAPSVEHMDKLILQARQLAGKRGMLKKKNQIKNN